MTPFNNFFPPNIFTFISGHSIDFLLKKDQSALTSDQSAFLFQYCHLTDVNNILQVHGDKIIFIKDKRPKIEKADALMTDIAGTALAVRTADCLSLFLCDTRHGGIGLVHAGWRGSQKEIVKKTVQQMQARWEGDGEHIKAAFGPAIRACCYEVGAEFREYFPEHVSRREGKYFFDLAGLNKKQLLSMGVKAENIFDCGQCTCCNAGYFSYRREGANTGRMISLMMIKAEET